MKVNWRKQTGAAITTVLVTLALGILSSFVAAGLTYYLFKQDFAALASRVLEVLRVDEIVVAVDYAECERRFAEEEQDQQNRLRTMLTLHTAQAILGKTGQELDAVNQELVTLLEDFGSLPVSAEPQRIGGTLVPDAKGTYGRRLTQLRGDVGAVQSTLVAAETVVGELNRQLEQVDKEYRDLSKSQRKELYYMLDRIGVMLKDRQDTMLRVLQQIQSGS